jgi:hypothetical protein
MSRQTNRRPLPRGTHVRPAISLDPARHLDVASGSRSGIDESGAAALARLLIGEPTLLERLRRYPVEKLAQALGSAAAGPLIWNAIELAFRVADADRRNGSGPALFRAPADRGRRAGRRVRDAGSSPANGPAPRGRAGGSPSVA